MSNRVHYKEVFLNFINTLQKDIISSLEAIDGEGKFVKDEWTRPEGGGGKTCIITDGNVFEKGGVNTSQVYGTLKPVMQDYLNTPHSQFFACGLSLVLHPNNPFVPTVHANYRYFELYDEEGQVVDQWFGGGSDLTPYYHFEEDTIHFHKTLETTCNLFDKTLYPKYKEACDQYFYNHHRNEARGVGGLFFDHLRPSDKINGDAWYDFVTQMGNTFIDTYLPIVQKRKETLFTAEQKKWQEIRRGRYVEFNLIHDKGTLFGLKTNGRIESIFMSLPKTVRWEYNHQPAKNSEEEKLVNILKHPQNWI